MNTVATVIPKPIWDAKKFKWRLFVQGTKEALKGCPNWLYDMLPSCTDENTVYVIVAQTYQYAVSLVGDKIQIFSKKR